MLFYNLFPENPDCGDISIKKKNGFLAHIQIFFFVWKSRAQFYQKSLEIQLPLWGRGIFFFGWREGEIAQSVFTGASFLM